VRTRRLILDATVRLMQSGATPSVSDVAEAAQVSRATAYRYFPNQADLVHTIVEEALGPILQWSSSLEDAEARVTDLFEFSMPRIDQFEATFRAALKLSLEQWVQRRAGTLDDEVALQRGNRIPLLSDALAPLRERLSPAEFDRLLQALAIVFGIEGYVVLKDICKLENEAAERLVVWAARALIRAALAEASPESEGRKSQES